MKIFKKVLLILAAIVILFVLGFSWYAFTYLGCIPTTKTDKKINLNINGIHMASPEDPTKIDIINSYPVTLEALSDGQFSLTIDQKAYFSAPIKTNFVNSEQYLNVTIADGNKTIIFNNYYDSKAYMTSNELFTITVFPNTNKKIMSYMPSIIFSVFGVYLMIKIIKKLKNNKPESTTT